MLTIKNNQMQVVHEQRENEFIEKLIKEVYFDVEEAQMVSHQQLFQKFKIQARNAQYKYGFSFEDTIATYINTAFAFGENFDEEIVTIKHFLRNNALNEEQKAQALEEFATFSFEILEPDEDENTEDSEPI